MKTFFRLAKLEVLYAIFSIFQALLPIEALRLPALRVTNWAMMQMVIMAAGRMGELDAIGELMPRMEEMGFTSTVQGDTTIFSKSACPGDFVIKVRKERIKGNP